MENEMMSANKITLKYTTEDVFNEPKHKRRSARIQNLQNTELDPPELSPKLPNTIDFKNNESGQELFCVSDKRESYAFDTDHISGCENTEESDESLKSPNKSLQTRVKNTKDKKYFKRYNNAQIASSEMGIQTKDVFKMISKPIPTSPQIKSPVKSPLKTYTNPRKCLDKNESIESFGLPDNPLSYPNMPLPQMDQVLDVEILDAKEITIQDLKLVDEPWCIIDLEQHFSNVKEIRIKPDPQDEDKTCYPTKNCTESVNNDFDISLSPESKLKNRQRRRVVLENSSIEKQHKRLSPKKNILNTSKSKSDKIVANHSLTLEEHEVEIFNSRYVENSFDLTSVKTNRLFQKSPNKKNRNKTLELTDDEISSQNEIRTLRSSSVSKESEKEITKKQLLKKSKNKNLMDSTDLDKMTVVNDNCVSKRILRSSSCINLHNFEEFKISETLKKSKSQINLRSDNNLQNTSKNSYLDINKVIQDKNKPMLVKKEHARELKITLCPLPSKLKDESIEVKSPQNVNRDADISNRNSSQISDITTHFIKKDKIPTSCEMTLKLIDISKDSKVSVNFGNKKEKPKLISNENKESENIKTNNSIEKNEIAHKTNKVSLGSDLHSIQLQQERKISEEDVETLFPKLNYSEERTSKIVAFAKLRECFNRRRSHIRKSHSFNVSNSDKSPLKVMKTDVDEKNDSFDSCQMNASFNADLSDNTTLDILSPSTTSTPSKGLKGRQKKINKEEFNKINEHIQISISDQRDELLATKKQRKNLDNKNFEHDQTNGIVEYNKTEADKSSRYEDSCIPRIIVNEEHKELKEEQIEIDRSLSLKAVNTTVKKRGRPKKKVNKEIGNDNRTEITINVEYDKDEPSNSCSKSLRSREINKGKETNLAVIDQVEVDVVDDTVKRRNNSSNNIFHEDYCDDNIIGETKIEETTENCSSYQNCFSKTVSKLLQSTNKTLSNENNHITHNKYNLVTNKQKVECIDLNDPERNQIMLTDDQKNKTSHSILDVSDEEVSAINESIIARKRNLFPLNRIKTSKTSIQSRINKQITDLEAYVPPTRTRSKTNLGDAVNETDLTLNDGTKKITRSKTSLGKNMNELSTDSSFEDDIIPKRTRSKTSVGKRISEINENLISSPKTSTSKINSDRKKNEMNSILKKNNSTNGTKPNKIQLTDTNSDEDVSPRITRYRTHLGETLCKNDSNQTGNMTRIKLNNYEHKGFNKTLPLKETTSKNTNNQEVDSDPEFYSRITRIKRSIGIHIEDIIETMESHKSFPSKITRCKSSLNTRIHITDSAIDSLNIAETNNGFSKDETFSPHSTRTNPGSGAGRVCAHIENTIKEDVSSKNSLNGTTDNNSLNYKSVFPLKIGNSHGVSESLDMNKIEEDIKQHFDIPENIEYKENIKKISNSVGLEEHLYKFEENLEINKIESSLENKILGNYLDVEDSLKENIEEIMSPLDKTSSIQESSSDEKTINDRNLLDSIENKNDLGTEITKNNISSNRECNSLEVITKGTNEPCVNPNTEDCYVSETPKKAEEDKIIDHDNLGDNSKENLEDAIVSLPIKTEIQKSTNNDAIEKGTTLISDDLKTVCASENSENKIASLILDVNTDNCHRDQTEKAAKLDNSLTVDNCSVDDDNKDHITLNENQECNYTVKKRPRGRPRSKSVAPTYRFSASSENRNIINQEDEDSEISPSTKSFQKLFKRSHSVGPRQEYAIPDLINPEVGKIAWAQIGHYPFWPCVITEEPKTKNYMKSVIKRYGPRVFYHVRFFGDNGRRAWIYSKRLLNYTNRDDLQKIFDNLKEAKCITQLNAFSVKQNLFKKWTNAVEEVEHVQSRNFNLDQIINYMETTNGQFQDIQEVGNSETKLTTKGKKIHKEKIIKKNQLLESDTKVSHIKKKIKLSPSNSPTSPTEKESKKRTSKVAKDKNIIIKDEILDIEYNVSEGSIEHFGTYSFDDQRTLFKRNNLFKGIPKDKVCQFCFNFGEIFKCRGGCYGIYHLECSVQVLVEKVPKRRTIRNSLKMENAETFVVKIEKKENISGTQSEVDESHVQIITVPSSVCATPPRKTFPPDVMNMTLADRIDFKMKEIMKKFESTTYLKMLNELSSEENSPSLKTRSFSRCQDLFSVDSQNCSMLDKELGGISKLDQQSPISAKGIEQRLEEILEPSLSKHVTADSPGESSSCSIQNGNSIENYDQNFIGHITADSERLSELTSELNTEGTFSDKNNKPNKNRKSLSKHVTADSTSPNENKTPAILPVETKIFNGKLNGARKSLMKHVTADSDGIETIDSESLRSNSSRQSKQSENLEQSDLFKNIDPKNFKCGFCTEDIDPYCFICHESVSRRESNIRQKCSLNQCSRFYHPECLKLWPQTQWSLIQTTKNRFSKEEVDSFVCPQHVCHTCASDDPHAATSRCSGDKIVKCLCCPASYHSTNLCVPAGTEIITSSQIICPRHRNKSKNNTINTTWCFICNQGGNLICCEICPTSVHPECMTVNLTDDDKFICEDCESGRLPLYDEIVWVKVGQYKWWPGLILFPNEVPPNVLNAKHLPGEFVVKFFGTYDHFWVNRGRSFLFQEGDANDSGSSTKSKVQTVFKKAVEEAIVAHKLKKLFKSTQAAESASTMKPPPYIRIKVSKPVGNVKLMELDLSNTTACECDPSQPNPCGPDSNCLNRLLWTECNPEVCPAGQLCKNQSFEKREYPPLIPYKTEARGWGLKTLASIKKGQFVIEYVGELIDDEEYQRRVIKMHEQKEENYYFLTIHTNRMIDAGPKGNVARFMNHCCQPNCETQKWTVNGGTRVGLFATKEIAAHTELTFNYNLECSGTEKKVCKCGAPNCSGFIGVKAKQEIADPKKPKKSYNKKKEPVKAIVLPPCFICQKEGEVGLCNNKICNKAYHLDCLKLEKWPEGKKFVCPRHYCNICSKRTIRCCGKCLNSFCPPHSEGNIRYDDLMGFVCNIHEPTKADKTMLPIKKKRGTATSEDVIVTSTTNDNDENDVDDVPLVFRQKAKKRKNYSVIDTNTVDVKESENESQDETVSSDKDNDENDVDEVPLVFRQKAKKSKKYSVVDTNTVDVHTSLVKESENESQDETVSSDKDNDENDVDDVPLVFRQKAKKSKKHSLVDAHTSLVKESETESQDESVSNATASDFEDELQSKRKKKQQKRKMKNKRRKLKNMKCIN